MKHSPYLIGFNQENNRIVPVFGKSNQFFDTTVQRECQWTIVPVSLCGSDAQWVLNPEIKVPDVILEWMHSQAFFITTPQDDPDRDQEKYAVLMSAPLSRPEASRVGYLLYKTDQDHYHPITIMHGTTEYMIEMKGCGTPLGGIMGKTHWRHPQSVDKFHTRITGALSQEEAMKEYDALLNLDDYYRRCGEARAIKAIGYIPFTYNGDQLSVLWRLVPSSFRASFQSDDLAFIKDALPHYYTDIGKEVGLLISHPTHYSHHNLNLNNLVIAGKTNVTLTDLSEIHPLSQGQSAMNWETLITPNTLLPDDRMQVERRAFLKGLSPSFAPLRPWISEVLTKETITTEDILKTNWKSIEAIGQDIFTHRLTQGHDLDYLVQNAQIILSAYPASFFTTPQLKDWVKDWLVPVLETKLTALLFLQNTHKTTPLSIIETALKFKPSPTKIEKKIQDHITKLIPEFKDHIHIKHTQSVFGRDTLITRYLTQLLDPDYPLERRIALVQARLKECDHYIRTGICAIPTREEVKLKQNPYHQLSTEWIFPHLTLIHTYLTNEDAILQGAIAHKDSFSPVVQVQVDISQTQWKIIFYTLQNTPDAFRALLHSPTTFAQHLKLEYMSPVP